MSSYIKSVEAIQVLDSRGVPTLAVRVVLQSGVTGCAVVPAGVSTGAYEAVELRDGDTRTFKGRGVLKAVSNVNTIISTALRGMDACKQWDIDARLLELDGTRMKRVLGANAIVGASLAVADAAARHSGAELYQYLGGPQACALPCPFVTLISGGAHASSSLDIEEIMIVPHGARYFGEAVRMATEVYQALGELLNDDGYGIAVGDDGGFAPYLETQGLAFDYAMRAIERAGYQPGESISLALTMAASELAMFRDDGRTFYRFTRQDSPNMTSSQLIDVYETWADRYPIVSIEDGIDENDWDGWIELTERLGHILHLVGDDVFATSSDRVTRGVEQRIANAVLIRPSQVGTLSECLATIRVTMESGYNVMLGHRSGDSTDALLTDLAVAVGANSIKTGAPCRGERVAKFNRLLWIEHDLGSKAKFGKPRLPRFELQEPRLISTAVG